MDILGYPAILLTSFFIKDHKTNEECELENQHLKIKILRLKLFVFTLTLFWDHKLFS